MDRSITIDFSTTPNFEAYDHSEEECSHTNDEEVCIEIQVCS